MVSAREEEIEMASEADFDTFSQYYEALGSFTAEVGNLLQNLQEDERADIDEEYAETFQELIEEYHIEFFNQRTGRKPKGDEIYRFRIKTYEVIDEAKKLFDSEAVETLVEIEDEDYEKILEV